MNPQFNQPKGSTSWNINHKAVARAANVPESAVIFSSETTVNLDNKSIIYDETAQKIWGKPSGIPNGAKIISVSGSNLTYTGPVTVSLIPYAASTDALRLEFLNPDSSALFIEFKSVADIYGVVPTADEVNIKLMRYHPDGQTGGGTLVWNATKARTEHNGFTVFSPSRQYPTDWTNSTQRAAWYAATTDTTLGVWERNEAPGDLTVDFAGAKPYISSVVDTESIQTYQTVVGDLAEIKFGVGTYRCNIKPSAGMLGNAYGTILVPADISIPIVVLEYHSTTWGAGWYWKEISDITFNCESSDRSAGTCISYTTDTTVSSYANRGRWVFSRIILQNANVGIRKPYGNIGNVYNCLATANLNYGVWATAKSTTPVMHEGNDTFNKCHFYGCYKAAYRTDVTTYGSSLDTHFNQCIFEYNAGFGLLIRGSLSNQINVGILKVNGGHFEGNGVVGTLVDIDGVMMQPVDIYSQFIRYIEIEGILCASMTLVNSSVTAHRCQFSDVRGASYTYWDVDNNSQVDSYEDGSQYGRPLSGLTVHSVAVPNAYARNGFVARHRTGRMKVSIAGNNGFAENYDRSGQMTSATGSAYLSNQVQDALLGTYSARWTIPASTVVVLTDPPSFVMENGKYYVWTVAARWISGDGTLQVARAGGATLSQPLTKDRESFWKTFGGVGIHATVGNDRVALRVNGGTISTVIQVADFQILQFSTLAEALAWFNSAGCLGINNMP